MHTHLNLWDVELRDSGGYKVLTRIKQPPLILVKHNHLFGVRLFALHESLSSRHRFPEYHCNTNIRIIQNLATKDSRV